MKRLRRLQRTDCIMPSCFEYPVLKQDKGSRCKGSSYPECRKCAGQAVCDIDTGLSIKNKILISSEIKERPGENAEDT